MTDADSKPHDDAAAAAEFVPFAVIEAERDLPSGSLWMCGMAGGPMRWLRVTLDLTQPQATWPAQVLRAIAARLLRDEDGQPAIPFFGAVTGFVINHAHDRAVRYDRDGNAVAALTTMVRVPTLYRAVPR